MFWSKLTTVVGLGETVGEGDVAFAAVSAGGV
jgi:hypothetical protein